MKDEKRHYNPGLTKKRVDNYEEEILNQSGIGVLMKEHQNGLEFRILALAQNKQYKEAEKEFETAIQLNPKLFVAYYDYARAWRTQGKHEQAARLFLEPTEWIHWYSYGQILVSSNHGLSNLDLVKNYTKLE